MDIELLRDDIRQIINLTFHNIIHNVLMSLRLNYNNKVC